MSKDITISIPEVGVPGSATERQIASVERILNMPNDLSDLSSEQASMILGAKEYATLFLDMNEEFLEIAPYHQMVQVATIMAINDDLVLDYAAKWSRRNYNQGLAPEKLTKNVAYNSLESALMDYFDLEYR